MPTTQELLKSAGWTEADITAFDATKMKGIETVFATAEQNRQAAELAQRSATEMFENQITPALNKWGNDETNLKAERDYYKAQAEGAVAGGFVAAVAPFKAAESRDPGGRFMPNANPVPGSPDFKAFEGQVVGAMGTLADVQWKYRKLFGEEMPDSPTSLGSEAAAQKLSFADYAARKYDFAGKEAAKQAADLKAREDAIRKDEREAVERKFAEQGGLNPDVRQAQVSRYAEIRKAVADGSRPDPLKMTREQRHAQTAAAIRQETAARVN